MAFPRPSGGAGLPLGLTGATAPTRYVGGTTSGHPTTGTFAKGDFVIDETGLVWVCTTAGSPGTWSSVGAGADSGWINLSTLTYENSWADSTNPAQFRVIGNAVYWRGQIINGGANTQVNTNPLPSNAIPPIQMKLVTCPDGYAGNAPSISVSSAGAITAFWTNGSGMTLTGLYLTN